MAYRFDGVDDRVEFGIGPLNGYTFGAGTLAVLFKRSATGTNHFLISMSEANGTTTRIELYVSSGDLSTANLVGGVNGNQLVSNTSLWYLLACTFTASGGVDPRFHIHDGTSWAHNVAGGSRGTDYAVTASNRLAVGSRPAGALPFAGDIVCAGIKKANSTDATIETLSRTSFQAWRDFGFDWLIGFDSSLETAGVLQDQASPGTGDEIAIVGTTAVADPAGWAWVSLVTPVADFTGTPLTGAAPLSVTFTDTSTNTPTSWLWDFGDGSTSTSQNPTHSFPAGGAWTVKLTATNAAGSNTKTRTAYVTVTEAIVYAAGGGIEIY